MGKVAAIQMTSGHVVHDNLAAAAGLLREAKESGADIACLPENFSFIGLKDADKLAVAEADGEGPIQDFLRTTARALKMWILAGTTVIRGDSATRVANTSLLIDADGKRVARYDKIHLFDVCIPGRDDEKYLESTHVMPGGRAVVADTPVGRLGMSVCYDMRFPELYRELVAHGAEWLAMPAAFTVPTGRAHWETLLRARAIENLCYVVAPAQSGTHTSGRETYGDTLIIDYWGQVLSRLPKGNGVITAEFDLQKQAETRARFPALDNRRLGLAPPPAAATPAAATPAAATPGAVAPGAVMQGAAPAAVMA
jgi:nitrilase